MLRVRAHYFSVQSASAPDAIATKCNEFTENPPVGNCEIQHSQQAFRITDCQWDNVAGIFAGTIWRVRERNLPSKVGDGEPVAVGSPLGESASFAYKAATGEAIIQYSHTGPKHQVFGAFLEYLRVDPPVSVVPVLVDDAVARMRNAPIVRRIEYTLGDLPQDSALLQQEPIAAALRARNEVQGAHVRVEISLGHRKGGLGDRAKQVLNAALASLVGVKTLRAGVRENPEGRMTMLDLIGGHLQIELNIRENNRELDREHCRQRLHDAIRDRLTTSDEEADEGEENAAEPEPAPPADQ